MARPNQTAIDQAERFGLWVDAQLLKRLATRTNPEDYRVARLWPAICAWYADPTPGVAAGEDWLSLEVSFQTGDEHDDFPLDPPEGLDEQAPWFCLDFLRTPNAQDGVQVTAGLNLWFEPTPVLMAFLDHPEWDTGNLLGFDCLGEAGPAAIEWVAQPSVAKIIDAFADLQPVAVERITSRADDDVRLV